MSLSTLLLALCPVALAQVARAGEKSIINMRTLNDTTSASATAEEQRLQLILEALNQRLGCDILLALLVLTAFILLYRSIQYLNQYTRMLACLHSDAQRYFTLPSPRISRLKHDLLYAPLFLLRHSRERHLLSGVSMGTLPTRFQALFLMAVLATNVFFCAYDIPWRKPEIQVLPVLRNRTGTISVANLIPVVVMATVKNPLISLLGLSFDTFNMMHRWFARIAISEAAIHSGCHVLSVVQEAGWSAFAKSTSDSMIWTGLVVMVLLTVILLQSSAVVRHAFYETFLHLHVILVIFVFVLLWMHLHGFPQQNFLLAAIIVWIVSRFLRLCTLLYRTFDHGCCKATVEALPGDAVRLSFTTSRPWTFKPGQYIYVSVPSVGLWTLHPFSVAWSGISSPLCRKDSQSSSYSEKKLFHKPPEVEEKGKETFSFVIRKRAGFTNALYDASKRAGAVEGATISMTALIEGPYGAARSLSSYGTVLLFAGGVGITHQLPYVRHLVEGYANGTVASRKVVLVWIVQSPEHLEWIRLWMAEILGLEKRREVLRVLLYITRLGKGQEVRSPSETVQMRTGRPDIETLVAKECCEQTGCMAVSVCGPGSLQDEVRRVVRMNLGEKNIDYFEESFGW